MRVFLLVAALSLVVFDGRAQDCKLSSSESDFITEHIGDDPRIYALHDSTLSAELATDMVDELGEASALVRVFRTKNACVAKLNLDNLDLDLNREGRRISRIAFSVSGDSALYQYVLDSSELGVVSANLLVRQNGDWTISKVFSGTLISLSDNAQPNPAPAFRIVTKNPSFPGGQEALSRYLAEHLEYPNSAREAGISGVVQVQFTVATDGSIESPVVVQSVHAELDKAALQLVRNMPKWEPAEFNTGDRTPFAITLPIAFGD